MIKLLQNAGLCFNVDPYDVVYDVILLVFFYVNQSETSLQSDVTSFSMDCCVFCRSIQSEKYSLRVPKCCSVYYK